MGEHGQKSIHFHTHFTDSVTFHLKGLNEQLYLAGVHYFLYYNLVT